MLTATNQRPVGSTTSENLFSVKTVNETTASQREVVESLFRVMLLFLFGILGLGILARIFDCLEVEPEEPNQVAPPPVEPETKTVSGREIDSMKECPPEIKVFSIQ
uniref:Uncharacterized protein n=1 Tax=Caenorhabditis tropicalis TaxID=1561998 RepID=A0A1I7TLB9_9PELO